MSVCEKILHNETYKNLFNYKKKLNPASMGLTDFLVSSD